MFIERLQLENVRNLQQVELKDFSYFNVFVGENGSGKTSLLEAIAIASQGRSFRNRNIRTVINSEKKALKVFLQCRSDSDIEHRLGIERHDNNDYLIRINGADIKNLAQLSSVLPMLVLDPSSFSLIDGGASERRRFIDWAVFHVEPLFFSSWRRFNRLLKQRNSLLQLANTRYQDLKNWDEEYCHLAVEIEQFRQQFLNQYQPALSKALSKLMGQEQSIRVFYKNGWHNEKMDFQQLADKALDKEQLKQQLQASFERDKKYRRSHLGPQYADMQLRYQQYDARDILSRGQKKLLIAAMKLAQGQLVFQLTHKRPILLLDDLPSELDSMHLNHLLHELEVDQFQCFISCTDKSYIEQSNIHSKYQMFHVEHGRISAV